MEALLLYRAGTNHRPVSEGLRVEGITVRELLWTPTLNFEDLAWTIRTVCIYVDRDEKLLDAARLIKSVHPSSNIFLIKDGLLQCAQRLVQDGVALNCVSMPCTYASVARSMKGALLNEPVAPAQPEEFHYDMILNSDRRTVTINAQTVALRNKEYELLEFLLLHRGKLISRNNLIESVWDRNAKVSSNTLDVHIGRLRKKLEQWKKDKFIHTVHAIGYRFELGQV